MEKNGYSSRYFYSAAKVRDDDEIRKSNTKHAVPYFCPNRYMRLEEVNTPALERMFIEVNVRLNKKEPLYIRPLDKDINDVFNPKKNKAFRFGTAIRWVLFDDADNPIGRIAAFVHRKYRNPGDDIPVGGIGFFDCINDQHAANYLFDKARTWLSAAGMQAMDGPINFGERDRWWGLSVEASMPPVYCMNYHPPYYRILFEQYGFETFFEQFCFSLKVKDRLQDKFYQRHARIQEEFPEITARHIRKNELAKYASDFTTIYNSAWAGHGGIKQVTTDQVLKTLETMLPVMDEKIIWFTYYKDQPIALWTNIPDLNQWFKYLNGRFDLFGKLKFLWIRRTKKCRKFTGIVFGIVPEWQSRGIDAFMIVEGAKVIQGQNLYEDYEMQWIGDFNPTMINIAESLGTYRSRKLITYRFLFDREKPFNRHPFLTR